MAPKAMTYKANSVIYFKGDSGEKVYILKSGVVSLNSTDIETGQEIHDQIQTGEFFGVKSALGKYPREENALVLKNAEVLAFSVDEFEALISKNTRIILKMLKVFSNQLRRIHKRVRNLLAFDEQVDAEQGLFKIGEYYFKKNNFQQAYYALRRYQTYYPSGKYSNQVLDMINRAEMHVKQNEARDYASSGSLGSTGGVAVAAETPIQGDIAKSFYHAVSTYSQQNYQQALKEFQKISTSTNDDEYKVKSMYEMGRCMFQLGQYDGCIRHYTQLLQQYPKMPQVAEVLYYVGQCYAEKSEHEKANNFYKKILTMTDTNDPINRKAQRALKGGA